MHIAYKEKTKAGYMFKRKIKAKRKITQEKETRSNQMKIILFEFFVLVHSLLINI
jgi:hypothetical protein